MLNPYDKNCKGYQRRVLFEDFIPEGEINIRKILNTIEEKDADSFNKLIFGDFIAYKNKTSYVIKGVKKCSR